MSFTHFKESRWSTVCCFMGLLIGVPLGLLEDQLLISWESHCRCWCRLRRGRGH